MDDLLDLIVRMRPVFEKFSSLMFFIKDTQGKYIYASPSLLEFFGKSASEVFYKKSDEVWGENKRRVQPVLTEEKLLLSGEIAMIDRSIRIKNPVGEEKYVRVFKTALYNTTEDKVIGIIGSGINISADRDLLFSLFHIFFRRLSKSEKRYFFFKTGGLSRAMIAREMDTTVETIDSYRQRIIKKFKVNDEEMMLLEKIYKIFVNENFDSWH